MSDANQKREEGAKRKTDTLMTMTFFSDKNRTEKGAGQKLLKCQDVLHGWSRQKLMPSRYGQLYVLMRKKIDILLSIKFFPNISENMSIMSAFLKNMPILCVVYLLCLWWDTSVYEYAYICVRVNKYKYACLFV